MAVPAWTAREWRPLVGELCANVLGECDSSRGDEFSVPEDAAGARQRHQRQVLRADKVVAKLYSHRYMDTTPQQIHGEVEDLVKKMEIHLLDGRASKLRELAARCDYKVVKMLIELAEAPTRASDARVAVDSAPPLEALQAWNRLLTPSKEKQKTDKKKRDEAVLAANMEAELLQVAWEDDWWKERQQDDADDFDDLLDVDIDDQDESMGESDGDGSPARGIASRVLRVNSIEELSSARREGGGSEGTQMGEGEGDDLTDGVDEDDEDDEDELLLEYYLPLTNPADATEAMETEEVAPVDALNKEEEPAFSFETPSLLFAAVEAQNVYRSKTQHSHHRQPSGPRRIVHERTLVDSVFYALRGVESPLFEFRQELSADLFDGDFVHTSVRPSALAERGITVSHLSPMTLLSVLDKVTVAATDLQFLRDIAAFFKRSVGKDLRSTSAEGMADEVNRQLCTFDRFIEKIAREMADSNTSDVALTEDQTSATARSAILPTLLGVVGSFQEMFGTASWLKTTLTQCVAVFRQQHRDTVSPAQFSSELLSSLYYMLQVASVESSASSERYRFTRSPSWDSYNLLCKLFASALAPYLDAMDDMIFNKGYDARISLHRELFFVGSSTDRSVPSSPRLSAQQLVEQTFEDAMSAMISFTVDASIVPVFLRPLVQVLSEALESRQIMNRYLSQLSAHEDSRPQSQKLSDRFRADFVTLSSPSSNTFSLASCFRDLPPFEEIVRRSVTQHVHAKCMEINGAIANLFREKLQFREHTEIVRLFLLMHQQDVFTALAQILINRIQLDPVGWANNEHLNGAFQDAIQRLHSDGLLNSHQRDIAARLSIRIDAKEIEKLRITRHIDVTTLRHLQFKFSTPQPLRVLFSGSIVHKYSTLAILLIQVKLVELTLTNFKQGFRHRLCFLQTEELLRNQLVRLADMLHYTRAVLNYLANQMTGDAWSKVESVFRTSQSIREINAAHDEYLDRMLNSFFVLKKHEGFTRQFMQNFNDIIAYGSRVDEFVRTVERNIPRFFDAVQDGKGITSAGASISRQGLRLNRRNVVANSEFKALYAKLLRQLKNPEGNYENQLHVITIVLDAMVKNGASPHVNELLVLLTFNGFRSTSRVRTAPR